MKQTMGSLVFLPGFCFSCQLCPIGPASLLPSSGEIVDGLGDLYFSFPLVFSSFMIGSWLSHVKKLCLIADFIITALLECRSQRDSSLFKILSRQYWHPNFDNPNLCYPFVSDAKQTLSFNF
jgi:hypothetical protein